MNRAAFAAVLCLTFSSRLVTAQNLIANGDFGSGDLSGWSLRSGGVNQTTITYDGTEGQPSGSALLDRVVSTESDNSDYLYQVIPVTLGQQYQLKAVWKGDLFNGGDGRNWAEVMVAFVSDPGSPDFQIMYKKASLGGPNEPAQAGWDWESVLDSPDGGPADGIFTATDEFMVVAFNLGGRAASNGNTAPGYYFVDNVRVTPYPPLEGPVVTDVRRSGEQIILEGTDGPPSGVYEVLRSPDLELPLDDWLVLGEGVFDGIGDFLYESLIPDESRGFYRVRVTSDVSSPVISQEPEDAEAVTGGSVQFAVVVQGADPLSYQWYFNGDTVLTGETGPSLLLEDLETDDAGNYSVTIANRFGEATSASATLEVASSLADAPDGYATQNGGTTGGGNAEPQTVTSASQFRSAVDGNSPAVIIVQGRLDLDGNISIGSNKTIIGSGSNSGLYGGTVQVGGSNYIFQNLEFGPASGDVFEISGATNVFVTKCEFHDSTDELCSIVRQADFVTISWCRFYFDNPDGHSFAHLIGNGDGVTEDRGKLHVTLHHNWYDAGLRGRLPRVRFGHVHIYNNYYNSPGTGYCVGIGVECHIRLENSHFDDVNNPWADYGGTSNGEIGWAGLKFTDSSQPSFMPNRYSTIFDPPYPYILDPVDDVKSLVTAGAGVE